MSRRFTELRGVIRKAIVDEDVFGLTSQPPQPQALQLTTPGNQAFAFERSGAKVNAFMSWLRTQEEAGILEVSGFEFGQQVGSGIESAWTNKYVQSGYQRGIRQARNEMRKAGISAPTIQASGGIEAVFNNPFHIDRVGLLFTRTFNDLKNTTEAMNGQLSRLLARGLAEGQNPNVIARWLTKAISGPVGGELAITDTLGRFIPAQRRAKMIARTEIIRSHAWGTLQEFKNFGVVGVQVKAELVTAQDNRVCPDCEALEGEIFEIDKAWGIIPVHVFCRCAFLPVTVN
jgi:SPP1 gp7 family putative phage head morphogenesis protein